ncbi:DUF4403 family protein [Pontibacter flavimaris]|uniref:DUF4403 family protein n=1 Tax=Pontibacter flavimaris TaxID=1797110 RepID=A0A1Q5PBV4_9BACT|nr:DUF4403 family protein [Pontibacter flavimaris]OKL39684.1 hypothetical protein A3841_00170 [Pontibacter flavimaris]
MEDAVRIYVPVSVSYPALEGVLKSQLVGQYIPKPEEGTDEPPYAQILDVGISGSSSGTQEVILRIRIRILRTMLKRDNVDLYVLASLGYDNATQQLYVQQFHLTSRTNSGFFNTGLEVLVNKVAYSQILRKARVSLGEIISAELLKANGMLDEGLELKGIRLTGAVNEVRVQDITPLPDRVTLSVELKGNVAANVLDLSSLLPGK